jgi:hypothetical protein
MKTIVIVALIVLSATVSLRGAAAQTTAPNPNQQGMPSFAQPQETMAVWQFLTPVAPRPKQCHAVWYLAQFWHTDGWGHTVTWLAYTPYYVCY